MLCVGVFFHAVIYHYPVYMLCVCVVSREYVFCICAEWLYVLCAHTCLSLCVRSKCMCLSMCVIVYCMLYLSAFNAFRSPCTQCCVHTRVPFSECLCIWRERVCNFYTADRRVKPERPGVMSDARGGFLPTSPLACWLANGLLSGLADRLACSQRLGLPYLVVEGGGWR